MARRTDDLPDGDYRALADVRYALRTFLAFSERAARDAGLTPAQHQLLLAVRGLEANGVTASVGDLAERLQLQLHSAGELTDRAVERGLVTKTADPDDRRRALVTLTRDGRAVLRDLSVAHRDELRRIRTDLSAALGTLGED